MIAGIISGTFWTVFFFGALAALVVYVLVKLIKALLP